MEALATYTSYPLSESDWRGRFVFDLVQALAAHPDCQLRLWGPPGPRPANTRYTASSTEQDWLRALLERGGIAHLLRNHPLTGLVTAFSLMQRLRRIYRRETDVDLVHAYWLQTALPLMGTSTPLVASVLGTDMRLLSLPGMIFALRRLFRQRRTFLAPNAAWMVPILKQHFGDCATVRYMPFGIADRWFTIRRNPAMNPRRWLVVLRLTKKKIGPLFEWGNDLFGAQDELHLFGPRQENIAIPAWVHYHGPADPVDLVNCWYPSATGMISLSAHDEGRPQVLLEAMAAGLPVIASPLDAHREIVHHGKSGFHVDNAGQLAMALRTLGDPETNQAFSQYARSYMQNEIGTWAVCAERYLDAFHTVCETSRS